MAKLVKPYINTEKTKRVKLYPSQMNNDIYINLKSNLVKDVEKKCTEDGYISKVYKINDYSEGIICPENLDSSAIYDVKYSCKLCLPIENTMIICKIDLITKVLVKAKYGRPIICIIKISQINKENFNLNNNGDIVYTKNNQILKSGDFIKVNVIAKNFFAGDERIIILAELIDMASNNEVQEYYDEEMDKIEIEETEDEVMENTENTDNEEENSDNEENNNYVNL